MLQYNSDAVDKPSGNLAITMKLLIIQPSHYRARSDFTLHKTKTRKVVGLTLPYLAAMTPEEWEISLVDEQLVDIDFNAPADVVAITTWTVNALRAYDIADRFRKRGVLVMMGGPHVFSHAEEVVDHCDAVGIGEGETIWPLMLKDAAAGGLKKIYRSDTFHCLDGLPFPRYDLVNLRKYGFFKTFAVQSSRGCPFKCEFCTERFFLGHSYRYRPVDEVISEIKRSNAKNILFADSNFAGNLPHTMALMEALIPLKVRWSSLWSSYICTNNEFMDLAKKSGVLHVNIGLESIDGETIAGMNKRANKVEKYKEILHNLRRRQISYSLNFIFGWDTENRDVFDATRTFLMENKVPAAYFNILTPQKATPLYDRMEKTGRIIDGDQIGRWPEPKCHFKPTYCSPQELEHFVNRLYHDFYSYPSMLSRLPLPLTRAHLASWFINFSQRKAFRGNSLTKNFDAY